jgi:hypothetical protein
MESRRDVGWDTSPAVGAPDWRWALPRIAVLFVATRLLLLVVAVIAEAAVTTHPAGTLWTSAPILASLTSFDGIYYLGIAASGYHAAPVYAQYVDYAFFPLYPALVRIASLVTLGDVALAGVLVSNAAFAGGLVAVYTLSIRHFSRETAMWSLVFLSLAPGAVAFGLAYSDSLFLLFAAVAFLAAERRRTAAMGIAFALTAISRPQGIFLGLPLLVLILRDPELRARRSWGWLALAPVGLAGFLAFTWWLTGDPLAWPHAQAIWSAAPSPGGGPGSAVTGGAQAAGATLQVPVLGDLVSSVVSVFGQSPEAAAAAIVIILWLATMAFYLFLAVYFRRDRMPLAYVLVALIPFVGIVWSGRLMSAPRFLAVAWPFDWTLALRRSRWVRIVVPAVFVVLQCAFAWLAFTRGAPP